MLRAMYQEEFSHWRQQCIADYAVDLQENYHYDVEKAAAQAQKSIDNALPAGLASDHQVLLCIENDCRVVGYLWYQQHHSDIYIMDFAIYAPWQGQGIGHHVLAELEDLLREQGIDEIKLRVAANNPRAKRLYENCDFKVTGYNMSKSLN